MSGLSSVEALYLADQLDEGKTFVDWWDVWRGPDDCRIP